MPAGMIFRFEWPSLRLGKAWREAKQLEERGGLGLQIRKVGLSGIVVVGVMSKHSEQ
jgi:hypothetical protein